MTKPVESAVAELTIYIGAVWSTCDRFEPAGIVLVPRVIASLPTRSWTAALSVANDAEGAVYATDAVSPAPIGDASERTSVLPLTVTDETEIVAEPFFTTNAEGDAVIDPSVSLYVIVSVVPAESTDALWKTGPMLSIGETAADAADAAEASSRLIAVATKV
jgi:hypothetical protein